MSTPARVAEFFGAFAPNQNCFHVRPKLVKPVGNNLSLRVISAVIERKTNKHWCTWSRLDATSTDHPGVGYFFHEQLPCGRTKEQQLLKLQEFFHLMNLCHHCGIIYTEREHFCFTRADEAFRTFWQSSRLCETCHVVYGEAGHRCKEGRLVSFEPLPKDQCAICVEEFTKGFVETPCGHKFHGTCLAYHCSNAVNKCPICRKELPYTWLRYRNLHKNVPDPDEESDVMSEGSDPESDDYEGGDDEDGGDYEGSEWRQGVAADEGGEWRHGVAADEDGVAADEDGR